MAKAPAKKKMTMAEWERSPMDKKKDAALKKKGIKEGSKKDMEMDKKALKAYNAKKGK
jgi:hypothetical protein